MQMTSSMTSTTTPTRPRGTPLVPSRLATPPPRFELLDGDTLVGWVDGRAIGFHGFGNEVEAAHAAWIAYRTMTRRFARDLGRRPPPIDSEPLSLHASGTVEHIVAGARPIATLVRPGAGSRSGAESFGFELQAPVPASERTMRATAYLVYRAVRRSGTRWAMWAPEPVAATAEREPASVQVTEAPRIETRSSAPRLAVTHSATAFVTSVLLVALAAVMGMALLVAAPRTVTIPIAVALGAGLLASGLVAAADGWLASDRDGRTQQRRRTRSRDRTRERDEVVRAGGSRWGALAASLGRGRYVPATE